jgi:hypothetical protein
MLFNPAVFLIGLSAGIFLVCMMRPEPKVVLRYPTPENVGNTTYRDGNAVCYKYTSEEVSCDAEKAKVREYPIQ